MKLDLRIPLGLMFTLVGLILSIFGAVTRGSAIYAQSADLNINLIWGIVMVVFGVTMYLLGRHADKHPRISPLTDDRVFPAGHGH